jgi:hypothetical protein
VSATTDFARLRLAARAGALALFALGLAGLLLAAPAARAAEPVKVSVEGVVRVEGENASQLRDRAFQAAMLEAVMEVARGAVDPGRLESEEESVRAALRPRAQSFILTYRPETPLRRPDPDNPGKEQYVLRLNATVDAEQVQKVLAELGLTRGSGSQASVALRVENASNSETRDGQFPVGALESLLTKRLEQEGFVVVSQALRPGASRDPQSVQELARNLGADVGVAVEVRWTRRANTRGQIVGGNAEVSVRALRPDDGVEVAVSRFEAPGFAVDPEEAFQRALDAIEPQLAQNLVLQLERNLGALKADDSPLVRVALLDVSGLSQVEAVQKTLLESLGAREARVAQLGPRSAELVVNSPLSPGALQDRLSAVEFEGFLLEPVEVKRDRIDFRVAPRSEVPSDGPPEPN